MTNPESPKGSSLPQIAATFGVAALLAVFALGALVGLAFVFRSPKSGGPAQATAQEAPPEEVVPAEVVPAEPTIEEPKEDPGLLERRDVVMKAKRSGAAAEPVDPEEFSSAYEDNELAADRQYKGKWYVIEGKVDRVANDVLNKPYIAFSSRRVLGRVQCFLAPEAQLAAEQITRGSRVKLVGRVEGRFGNILVKDCVFLE